MRNPLISVVLPVLNGEKYIVASIESVLNQSESNFELIIIDDGSKDSTPKIIEDFKKKDSRIIALRNEVATGLVYSLNRGIASAKGMFIARMDADDICHLDRFKIQSEFLIKNKSVSMVASTVRIFNEAGLQEPWLADIKNITSTDIKFMMIKENCVAHPTIMIRSEVIKKYRYSPLAKNVEDYELWLRLLGNNFVIEKIQEPLLDYRIHAESVTSESNIKFNSYLRKQILAKFLFLKNSILALRLKKFHLLVLQSLVFEVLQFMKICINSFGRRILISLGRFSLYAFPEIIRGKLIFFPCLELSEQKKIHSKILEALDGEKCTVFLTSSCKQQKVLLHLSKNHNVRDISYVSTNKFLKLFMLGRLSTAISFSDSVRVFGSSNAFFYDLVEQLNPEVFVADFLYGASSSYDEYSRPYISRLNKRVVLNQLVLRDLAKVYEKLKIEKSLIIRVQNIENDFQAFNELLKSPNQ